ncbi:MAG: hypothetical protein ACT4NJ_09050 [Nitrosopumilaceae archaeon]
MANSVQKKNPGGIGHYYWDESMAPGFSFAYYSLEELLDISEYVQKKTDKPGIKSSH